jgi:hypothetical protein
METFDLLKRATNGDATAIHQLIALQREGKAMRLYPNGRKGALDEGVAPLEILPTEHLMVRFCFGVPRTVVLSKDQLASTMLYVMQIASVMANHYGDDIEEMESHVAPPNIGFVTKVAGDQQLSLMFTPQGYAHYDLGFYHCRKLLDGWITLIEQNEWDHEDIGFSDSEYADLLMFAVEGY